MFYFVADALQKKSSSQKNTWSYIKVRNSFTFPIAIVASGFITEFSDFPDGITFCKLAGASMVCALGLFYYIKSINHIQFSNVGSLSIVGNVFQWLLGWIFFTESVSWLDLPAMLLMFSGCLIQLFNAKLNKGAFYVLACSFFWVTGFSLLSTALKNSNVYWSIPIMEGTILGVSIFAARSEKGIDSDDTNSNKYFYLLFGLISILIYSGSVFNHIAYQKIPLSTISLLQLSMMPIGYLLSLKLFREKASITEWFSFLLGVVGFAYLHFVRHLLV
jgi:drug/metabolite transporter (DMT)-like permease